MRPPALGRAISTKLFRVTKHLLLAGGSTRELRADRLRSRPATATVAQSHTRTYRTESYAATRVADSPGRPTADNTNNTQQTISEYAESELAWIMVVCDGRAAVVAASSSPAAAVISSSKQQQQRQQQRRIVAQISSAHEHEH
ncbi:unnamed protein product, partial [Trichogramma brassicae]